MAVLTPNATGKEKAPLPLEEALLNTSEQRP